MAREIFADGIDQIHFSGGMVRLDLFTLQPSAQSTDQGQHAAPVTQARIIMTPQGFLSAFAAMQNLADKLVEAGVLKKAQSGDLK